MNLRLRPVLVLAFAFAWPGAALAQVSAADAAAAEKLFEDARALMARGDYGAACPKLAESQRLDPGVGTLLNLGDCYEKNGQVASAWATYQDAATAATRAGQKPRAKFAQARADELKKRLVYLKLEVRSPAPGEVVSRDGVALGGAAWGTPIPIDPGEHRFEATAPGRRTWSKTVTITGPELSLSIPELEQAPVEPAHAVEPTRPPAAVIAPPAGPAPAPAPEQPAPPSTTRVTVGWVLGGVGVVGLGVGAVLGLRAKSLADEANSGPCSPVDCDAHGIELTHDAKRNAGLSTVAFAVGGAALLGGLVLVLTGPSTSARKTTLAPAIGPASAGAVLGGRW
jgi:serine/threonine-protein kinase